jgi:hypothetical protein
MEHRLVSLAVALSAPLFIGSTSVLAGNDRTDARDSNRTEGKDNDRTDLLPLMVYDSNGKTVGKFGGGPGGAFVQITLNGSIFAVDLINDFFQSWTFYNKLTYARSKLYFPTPDCTGTPYAPVLGGIGMQPSAIVEDSHPINFGETGTLWFYPLDGGHAWRHAFPYNSTYSYGTCTATPGSWDGGGRFAPASAAPTNITKLFAPPFTVR